MDNMKMTMTKKLIENDLYDIMPWLDIFEYDIEMNKYEKNERNEMRK